MLELTQKWELAPFYSPSIPTIFIGAIPSVGSWVVNLEAQCMHLFYQNFTQIYVKILVHYTFENS
jgi:hypothetical protein